MARKKSAAFNRWVVVAFELIGLGISLYLFMISMRWIYGGEIPCLRSRWFECKTVVRGQFSHIGPVPIAGMGVFYFVWQLALTLLLGKKQMLVKEVKLLSLIGGIVFLAALRAIEIVWLRKVCPWCWGVALMVLCEAVTSWPALVPPMPRWRLVWRIMSVFFVFFLFAAASVGIGHEIKNGMKSKRPVTNASAGKEDTGPTPTSKPRKTPAIVAATARPSTPPNIKTTPEPRLTPTPRTRTDEVTPTPANASGFNLDSEPDSDVDTPEASILRARGWKVVARTDSIEKAIVALAPVLMLAFDPYCEECQWLTNNTLSKQELDDLPVTRIAIEQSSLEGKISEQVKQVPTLMLFDQGGHILWKHDESRLTVKQLREKVTAALGTAQ